MKKIKFVLKNRKFILILPIFTIIYIIFYLSILKWKKSDFSITTFQDSSDIEILLCWNYDIWEAAIDFGFKEINLNNNTCNYQIAYYKNKKTNKSKKLFIALHINHDCNYFVNISDKSCPFMLQNGLNYISYNFPNNNLSITSLATAGLWQANKKKFPKLGNIYQAIAFNIGGNVCSFTNEAIKSKSNKFQPAIIIISDKYHEKVLPGKKVCEFTGKYILLSSNKFPDIKLPKNINSLRELYCITDLDYNNSYSNAKNEYKRNKKGCSKRLINEVILKLS